MPTNPTGPADPVGRAGREGRLLAGVRPVEQDRPPPVVVRWVCCHCGGTGLTGDGDTCPHCLGHGHDRPI